MKVKLQEVSKRFGSVQANDRVNLTIAAGTIHGLLGENGAGKSTLVKMLSGFLRRDGGDIYLDDRPVELTSPADAIRAGIGMLHQDPLDFPPMTVLDNFLMGRWQGIWVDRRSTCREFYALSAQLNFSLDDRQEVRQLTVGERQQLEILRLLSLGVKTLILDEPTTGISAHQKTVLFAAMKQLAHQGKSVIFVSHKLEDVAELCHEVTVMRQGQVVGQAVLPCAPEQLVQFMFGKELAPPTKPPTRRGDLAAQIRQVTLVSDRLQIHLPDLDLYRGEIVGLAGLEGSGQDLFLQFCAGLYKAHQGDFLVYFDNSNRESINLMGKPYSDYLRAGVGYVPADRLKHGLIAGLSIQEHFALKSPQPHLLIQWPQIRQVTQEAIALFNIRGQAHSHVDRLSGGNQQRTQLALLPVPLNLLLLEHPTRGLDIESTRWVWQQLIARCQGGTTILFMSADLDEIAQYSDRVLIFSGGQISAPLLASELTADRLGQAIGGRF